MEETQETWVQYLGREDPLEEEMATYSSILAWEILWTEETCGLQSTGSQTVRHDCVTKHAHEPRLYLYLLMFGVMSIPQNFLFPDPRVLVNQIGNTGNFRLIRPL